MLRSGRMMMTAALALAGLLAWQAVAQDSPYGGGRRQDGRPRPRTQRQPGRETEPRMCPGCPMTGGDCPMQGNDTSKADREAMMQRMERMLKSAGVSQEQISRMKAASQAKFYMSDPGVLLGRAEQLDLSAQQVNRLQRLQNRTRRAAVDVLSDEQRDKIDAMAGPFTMREMMAEVHKKMRAHHREMMQQRREGDDGERRDMPRDGRGMMQDRRERRDDRDMRDRPRRPMRDSDEYDPLGGPAPEQDED